MAGRWGLVAEALRNGVPSERVEGGQGKNTGALKLSPLDPKGLAWMLRGTRATLTRETQLPAGRGNNLSFGSSIWKPFTFFLVNLGDSIIYK